MNITDTTQRIITIELTEEEVVNLKQFIEEPAGVFIDKNFIDKLHEELANLGIYGDY